MSAYYETTANRLRPKTFTELTGQEFVVSTVCNSIEQNNIAHAYLFSGPRGVGKTSAARLVALAINRPPNTPINELAYSGSEDIRLGKAPDVIEIDGASYTSVENVRNIREEIKYTPVQFPYKVYIIDEVHMLSHSAFNALLKTIEEPPEYVVFIFATTELQKVPTTIRSRCQQFSFRLISNKDIIEQLEKICIDKNITYEDIALQWIAKEAQGSFRDAYTLFDQICAFCKNNITLEKIKSQLGLVGTEVFNKIFSLCIQKDRTQMFTYLDSVLNQGVSIEHFIIESAEYVRNVLLIKSDIYAEDVVGYSIEWFDKAVYNTLSIFQLEKALALLLDCYKNIRYSANIRFEVELVFSQLCDIGQYITPQQLVEQLTQLKLHGTTSDGATQSIATLAGSTLHPSEAQTATTVMPKVMPAQNHTTAVQNNATPQHNTVSQHKEESYNQTQDTQSSLVQDHTALWRDIISRIAESDTQIAAVLDSAEVDRKDATLLVSFKDEHNYQKYSEFADKIIILVQKMTHNNINNIEHVLNLQETHDTVMPVSVMVGVQQHIAENQEKTEDTRHNKDTENVLKVFGGTVERESH